MPKDKKNQFEKKMLEGMSVLIKDVSELKTDVSDLKEKSVNMEKSIKSLNVRNFVLNEKVNNIDRKITRESSILGIKIDIIDKKVDGLYIDSMDLEKSINLNQQYTNQAFEKISEIEYV